MKTDDAIKKLGEINQSYFSQKYFESMRGMYEGAKEYFEESQKRVQRSDKGVPVDSEQEARILNEKRFQEAYFKEKKFVVAENAYFKALIKLSDEFEGSSRIKGEKRTNITLPQVKIPTFSRNYEKWAEFEDTFGKLVHENKMLSEVEKMQYLKIHISGEVARVIQHFHITSDNYEAAWEILDKKFNNRKLTVSKLVDKIFDLPQLYQESFVKIKELHDTTKTRKQYEMSIKNPMDVQELENIMEFMR
ncbi:hypothetical protein TcasGA2_TC016139 [Tribolium castaneum]|uniref:Uncharacterized protein n=1 Tax=Tribolium castaneum TaxID=7070 RepID=D7ELZ0_TRICA|nr:hypothetical protein TcasGA2_TC016139 [Tribolium castaneum]